MIRGFVHFIQNNLHIQLNANVERRIGIIARFLVDLLFFHELSEN